MRKFAAATLLVLGACSSRTQGDEAASNSEQTVASNAFATEKPLSPPGPGEPGGLADDRTPLAEGPIEPKSAQGAGQVLQHYFALAEQGKFAEANALWSKGSDRLDLGRYKEVHAMIGAPGALEGAAGSIYVDIPVQLYGRTQDGREFNSRGTMTLRRANDVPGSTAEQRRWHIYKSGFADQASSASYRFVGRWAANVRACPTQAWRFTATSLRTPAGSVCTFRKIDAVPGGYDITARCTAEGPPVNDVLELRFAESAKALLFESNAIAHAGLVRCS